MAPREPASLVRYVGSHSLFWLMAGNAVGLWLALLLLFPDLNLIAGEFSYGRLVPLHLNFQLYGWSSLPLVAWLFELYPGRDSFGDEAARGGTLAWSCALSLGASTWLLGENSGKIFLEWKGLARVTFAFALLFLWCVLASRFWHAPRPKSTATFARIMGLIALAAVPSAWYWSASPFVYPAVNPDTSGPTAASLLGSTLGIILILLLVAPSLGKRNKPNLIIQWTWLVFFLEAVLFAMTNKGNRSHHSASQVAILGALLIWIPLLPAYFRAFLFPAASAPWRRACLGWFLLLAATGWLSFLPRVLDDWKFTNALVAHSHLAMAGFVTCLNFFLLTVLGGGGSWPGVSAFWFRLWNSSTLGYVLLMWTAGTLEAADPSFTIVSSPWRTALYGGRAIAGAIMLICSVVWWRAALSAPRRSQAPRPDSMGAALPLAV